MAGMMDSHAHICGKDLSSRWRETAAGAKNAGIEKIMIVCRDAREARRAIDIAGEDSMFDVAFGYSPNDTLKVGRTEWEQLEQLLANPLVKAIGDIGMDYFYYETVVPQVLQKELFVRQMELANRVGKPALIHMRMAGEDTRRYIKGHLKVPGIMHNYSGGWELMKDFLDIGMYLSFSGRILLEASDESTRIAVREVPLDRLFLESDAPLTTPVEGGQSLRLYEHLDQVLDYVCGLRGMEREALVRAIHDNYMRLFPRNL